MTMNIKSSEAHRMARELAQLTGESLTEAVTVAIQERLQRIGSPPKMRMSEQLRIIGEECAGRLKDLPDHAELLYGPDGMPH